MEQTAGSSTRKDGVGEKAIDHFQKPQEGGSSTSMDEVEEKVESEKATASDYFKKQVKGLKTTTAALKFRVSWNCVGLQTGFLRVLGTIYASPFGVGLVEDSF